MDLWYNRKEVNIEDAYSLADKCGISPAFAMILLKREVADVSNFLEPNVAYMREPRLLKDAEKGCNIIYSAIASHEKFCIVNDYDVDGITSGEIMRDVICSLGGNAFILTPDRLVDGYGISKRLIDLAHEQGATIIVTTDNGIAASEQIAYAKELGFTVVITDHHEVPFEEDASGAKSYILPCADAIIDPKQSDCPYPFKDICGASVVFKLASILLDMFNITGAKRSSYLCKWGELCAIATICDVMPLVDENRMYVSAGLSVLRYGSNYIGIRKLLDEYEINASNITSYHIGFIIGPCLNSSGRMTGSASLSQKLLSEKDQIKAQRIAHELHEINEKRKNYLSEPQELAYKQMFEQENENVKIHVLYIKDIPDSLCGIIAGRCKETSKKPCIVLTNTENGILKGSGRSIDGFNLFYHLSKHKHLFEAMGGHPLAAGMSLPERNLDELIKVLNEDANAVPDDVFEKAKMCAVDLFMSTENITDTLVTELSSLEPFGNCNEKPIFCEELAKIRKLSIMGKNRNTLKIYFFGNKKSTECIYWGDIKDFEQKIISQYGQAELDALYAGSPNHEVCVDFLYSPSFNYYNNQQSIQFVINDIRLSMAS